MPQSSPLDHLDHRPYPLPAGPWRMRQSWNDLLFAHWPLPPQAIAPLLPPGLDLDTWDGQAWLGVVPFWMNNVRTRILGHATLAIPTVSVFSELNLRTYVRSRRTGIQGVFFFSLDCSSPLAVLGARVLFHLPYFCASIRRTQSEGLIHYESQRHLTRTSPAFSARFAPTGDLSLSQPGSLASFLTERYCLFTHSRGRVLRGDIHHQPWPLQPAQAEITLNQIPQAHGMTLPDTPPILHFSRSLDVYIWPLIQE